MTLVDTSVWVDHLRKGEAGLQELLVKGQVICHPFVIGELAMGQLRQRDALLRMLADLPLAIVAHEDEVLRFVADRKLFGLGIGYIDAHLLAAVQLTGNATLWTRDQRLSKLAAKFGVSFSFHP